MPRGKYDRKESRIKRLAANLEDFKNRNRQLREELERRGVELKAAHDVGKAKLAASAISVDRFAILRDNLQTLTNARKMLLELQNVSPEVMSRLDYEISVHIHMLMTLREETFQATQTTSQTSPAVFQSQRPDVSGVQTRHAE